MPSILVVHPEAAVVERISLALKGAGHQPSVSQSAREAAHRMALARPDLLILAHALSDTSAADLIQRLRAIPRTATMSIVVMAPSGNADARISALEAGADAILLEPFDERELVAVVNTLHQRVSRFQQAAQREPGKVITFCAAKGGVGTTSICVNTAASLAKQKAPARVVCVDLVLPVGSISDMMGLEPEDSIAMLSNLEPSLLDPFMVNGFLHTREGLGFEALLGARDPGESQQVNPAGIEVITERLKTVADYILVDIGRSISRISLPILKMSHRVVMVLSADQASLRLSQVALDYFRSLGITEKRIVLVTNRAVGREGAGLEEIQNVLDHPIQASVPYEGDRFTAALNAGLPLVLKEPGAMTAPILRDLAHHLTLD
ncbi:MAG: response regulator [Chloroflexi bacterium]|nr:response regulator [Chloroflexota bacterium]